MSPGPPWGSVFSRTSLRILSTLCQSETLAFLYWIINPYSNHRDSRKWRERVWESIWTYDSWKFPQHGKRNSHSSPGSTESPSQDKPKRNTPRHILIKLTKIKYKEKILKATNHIQGNPYKFSSWFLSRNYAGQKGVARCILKWWKRKTCNQESSTQQGSHSDSTEKLKAL